MASSSDVGETMDVTPGIDKIAQFIANLHKLVESTVHPKEDGDLSHIAISSFRKSVTDMTNELQLLVQAGMSNITNEHFGYLEAYACAIATLTLTKLFKCCNEHLQNNIDKKEHNKRLEQIKKMHGNITATLKRASDNAEQLQPLLMKMLNQGNNSNNGIEIQFNVLLDFIDNDLNFCMERLIDSKRLLMEGFSSANEYEKRSFQRAGEQFAWMSVTIANFVIPLFEIIGTLGAAGAVGVAAVFGLGYTAYKLNTDLQFAKYVTELYQYHDANQKELQDRVLNMSKGLEQYKVAVMAKAAVEKLKAAEEKQKAEEKMRKAAEEKQKAEEKMRKAAEEKQKAEEKMRKAAEEKQKAEEKMRKAAEDEVSHLKAEIEHMKQNQQHS